MSSLRILLVHERFAPDYGGGGEYVVLELAKGLQRGGHEVRVVTTGNPADSRFDGVPLRRLPMSRYRMNGAWSVVAREARTVDVIHCFTYHAVLPAVLAGLRLRKPVVLGVLALFGPAWLAMRGPLAGRLFAAFERWLLRLPVRHRVFLSAESRAMAPVNRGASDHVIHPGIGLEDYGPAPIKDGVVFSGKLDVRKGWRTVCDVAAALPDIPFRMVCWGDGLDEMARCAPANVTVVRFEDRLQLARELAAARIFLFPSQAETFGLAVAEAMASGCAVVASAPIEFAGIRIDPAHRAAIVAAVRDLWSDPERCASYGERNRRLAHAYGWQQHIVALEKIYAGLVEPHHETT